MTSSSRKITFVAALDDCHNGNTAHASRLVSAALAAGCDGVKVLVRDPGVSYSAEALAQARFDAPALGNTWGEIASALSLRIETWKPLRESCRDQALFVVAPWDLPSFTLAQQLDPDVWQLDPPALTDAGLVEAIAASGKPTFVVAAGCDGEDLDWVLEQLHNAPVCVVHSVAAFVPIEETQLASVQHYGVRQAKAGDTVGYLSPALGTDDLAAALALGATVIEKRVTIDRGLGGNWHADALHIDELGPVVSRLRQLSLALEPTTGRALLPTEADWLEREGRGLVAARWLPAGSILSATDVVSQAPKRGISSRQLHLVIGRRLLFDLDCHAPITFGMFEP